MCSEPTSAPKTSPLLLLAQGAAKKRQVCDDCEQLLWFDLPDLMSTFEKKPSNDYEQKKSVKLDYLAKTLVICAGSTCVQ